MFELQKHMLPLTRKYILKALRYFGTKLQGKLNHSMLKQDHNNNNNNNLRILFEDKANILLSCEN